MPLYLNTMPKFKFNIPAPADSATAYSKVQKLLKGENDFKKFDPKVSCTFDDDAKSCSVNGSQFKANLSVVEKDKKSSTIDVEVELPLALSLFKGKIQEALEKNVKKIFS